MSVRRMWLLTCSCWEEREAERVLGQLHNWGWHRGQTPKDTAPPRPGGRERTLHCARPSVPLSAGHTRAPRWGERSSPEGTGWAEALTVRWWLGQDGRRR